MEYVEDNLSESVEDLEDKLEDASKKLKKNLEKLASKLKKEVKSEALNFYHDNKELVNTDLKTVNAIVKEFSKEVKKYLSEDIDETVGKDERKALIEIRSKIKKFTRRYNRKYALLRVKLAIGNAEMDLKNIVL